MVEIVIGRDKPCEQKVECYKCSIPQYVFNYNLETLKVGGKIICQACHRKEPLIT